jgi:hypothetical protein
MRKPLNQGLALCLGQSMGGVGREERRDQICATKKRSLSTEKKKTIENNLSFLFFFLSLFILVDFRLGCSSRRTSYTHVHTYIRTGDAVCVVEVVHTYTTATDADDEEEEDLAWWACRIIMPVSALSGGGVSGRTGKLSWGRRGDGRRGPRARRRDVKERTVWTGRNSASGAGNG